MSSEKWKFWWKAKTLRNLQAKRKKHMGGKQKLIKK